MVSRRKILSRSRDDLNLDQTFSPQEEEEDVWYQKDKLYKEHIQEVLDKWTQIDDEIWAKVIVFERNRRVAKAYARAPVLTINGSDDGFDGMRIGLCGFDNPMRDQKTEEFKKHIGQGVKIKMDDAGNILIRRYAKSNVYIKSTANNQNEETSIGADILKLPNQALESEKIVKLFDMKKFQSNVNRELRRAYPDRRRLETQCLSAVAFVRSESDVLECPIWVLIVNVVAMDMLKSKLPPVQQRPIVDIKNRPRIPIPDEDPYSVAGNGSGGSSGSSGFGASALSMMSLQQQQQILQQQQQQQSQSMTSNNNGNNNNNNSNINGGNPAQHLNNGNALGVVGTNGNGHVAATREQLIMQSQQLAHKRSEKPPKLPPRDNIYGHDIPKPDYDDIEVDTRIKLSRGKSDKGKDNKKYDDPYYCGLRARVPNFVKSSPKLAKEHLAIQNGGSAAQPQHMNTLTNQKKTSVMMPMHPAMHAPAPPHMHPHHIQQQQMMAVVAAHAAAQQQQQQQQQHHHHAAAQQMWQTRSYESGIGIYNHNNNSLSTTTTTAATAATATNFNTDMQLQHMQQQQLQTSSLYYPSTSTASSNLYNYHAPNYNEHLHQQQHQAASATSSHTSSAITPLSNAITNLLQQPSQSVPIGHMTNNTNNITAQQPPPPTTPSIQLSTNLTFATSPIDITATTTTTKPNNESLYGQTRNLNFKQVHNNGTPHQHQIPNQNHHHRNGHQHHSRHSHLHHQRRHHHHPAYGCLRHPTSHSTGDMYFRAHDSYYDDDNFDMYRPSKRPSHMRASRRSTSSTSQIDKNCNCVSCYALAPLFGAPTPKRPPRSLSQQQLRQHQRLSGAKNLHKKDFRRGVVKWCSDSDVSLLGRDEFEQSEEYDDYGTYAKPKNYYDIYNNDDFNLDQDFDIENFNLSQMDYKKQIQKPKPKAKFNGYAARHEHPTTLTDDHQHPLTDGYVDKVRLRQIRSPTPKRKQSQTKDYTTKTSNPNPSTNLLTMRTKSQSTESFFEQPHDEGTIYLYGGRKRIQKAPSTTNIYDRVKANEDFGGGYKQAKKYNSQLNLNMDQRKIPSKLYETRFTQRNDHDTIKPLIPAPMWRGAKRINLKGLNSNQSIDFNNNNNNNNKITKQDLKQNFVQKTEELARTFANSKNTGLTNNNNNNSNNNYKTTAQSQVKLTTHNNNDKKQNEKETLQQQQQKQTEQQQQPQLRMGRSASRVDISDMESIYGYLKPRKPRSLSMKKIQILDY